MLMRKKFEITKLSGISGMKRLIFNAHARCVRYLAWSISHQSGLSSLQRDFFYPSCHMPDMPDVFKLFCVKSDGEGGYTAPPNNIRHDCIPPQRSEK